jgi:hypothetical protein
MNRINALLHDLHDSEADLTGFLLHVSDRHRAEHEVFHVARDLAGWSAEHLRYLARIGSDRGLDLDPEPPDHDTLMARVRQKAGELVGRRSEAGLLLLADLREVHVRAAGVSVDWVMLGQVAQAVRDQELLDLTSRCHPETLRQLRWANATIKVTASQILSA